MYKILLISHDYAIESRIKFLVTHSYKTRYIKDMIQNYKFYKLE